MFALTMVKKSGRRIREYYSTELERDRRCTQLIRLHPKADFYYDEVKSRA
jgi:hypothetical protein